MGEEPHGLLDDDPALDCILLEEMRKEGRGNRQKPGSGCLGLLVLMVMPAGGLLFGLHYLVP